MAIYIVWEMLAAVFLRYKVKLRRYHVTRKEALRFLSFILWMLMALRSINMGLTDTAKLYYPAFCNQKSINIIDSMNNREPLMGLFIWLGSNILGDYQVFLAVCCIPPIFTIVRLIDKYSINPIQGIVIYFSLFYFYNSFLIKQMLSLSLIILSYDGIRKRRLWRFLLYVSVASLFHNSALVFLIIYPACLKLKFNKTFFIIIGIGLGIGIFFPNLVLKLLYNIRFYRFESYIKHGVYKKGTGLNFGIFLYIVIALFCFLVRGGKKQEYNDLLILVLFGCICNSWSTIIVEFYRVSIYFSTFCCLLLPEAIENCMPKYKRLISSIIMMILMLYAFKTASNTNCLPYQFFFIGE